MNVLVDTCIWSETFRRRPKGEPPLVSALLRELIRESRALVLGPVRQEILSGIKEPSQFVMLRDRLRSFPDLSLLPEDYETAAELFNRCRASGIQGSNTDFLICSVSRRLQAPIFSTDGDFKRIARMTPLRFYDPKP